MTEKTGTEVVNWEEKLAQYANKEVAVARPSSSTISFRAGMISYEGTQVPGNKLTCLVLDAVAERTYYASKFDPDNPSSPACFALGRIGEELAPHESIPEPQHTDCLNCPWNKWKSAGDGRRGKACQERKRLILIPETSLKDADSVLSAEVATARLPVTSGRNWDNYVLKVAATMQRPTWSVLTEISIQPDPKKQFVVNFNVVREVELTLLNALEEKRRASEAIAFKPYDISVDDGGESEEPQKGAKGSKHRA